jgi:stage II sporulation protein D
MASSIKFRLRRLKTAIMAAVITACLFSSASFNSRAATAVYLRVLVLENRNSASLAIEGSYEVLDKKTGTVLFPGTDLNTTLLEYNNTFLLGEINLKAGSVIIRSLESNVVKIDGREFRGDVRFISDKEGSGFSVINYLELEEYVKGVLYHEVSHHWPIEALKAQAVASRTFALYQQRINRAKDYDLTADIYSQVYGGKTSERYRTNRAVEETRGEIIIYNNEVLPAYYSATCAGHTEDASRLWDVSIKPLKGVECGFCADSPHIKWHRVIALQDIREALNKAGLAINQDIKEISILSRDDSGRIDGMRIHFGGESIDLSGKNFRNAVGPNIIRSADFKVRVNKNHAYFEGRGWGHGVGLCQWGAYFMAKRGFSFRKIIGHYYPGSRIGLIDEIAP